MFTVPDCPEWACLPGFTSEPCFCVKSLGVVEPTCRSCGGKGTIGHVPCHVRDAARAVREMPRYDGDPRFDFRRKMTDEMISNFMAGRARAAREARRTLVCFALFASAVVGSIAAALVYRFAP